MGIQVMHSAILRDAIFILLCIFVISDISIAVKSPSEGIEESRKLEYQENDVLFSPLTVNTERDNGPGNVRIVNPTVPGTTPIVNPASPQPPTFTGPPTTTNPATPGPPATTGPTTSGGSWCIANPSASQTALQVALDYACGYGGANCSPIQPSGPCYNPSTLHDHASYAFNDYYQKNPVPTSCAFGGSAQLSTTDPSNGNCRFTSLSSTSTTPPRMTPTIPLTPMTPTIPMTPPSTTTPVAPFTPGNVYGSEPTGNNFGSEPTGTPSAVGNLSVNLPLLTIMNCLILSVAVANNF